MSSDPGWSFTPPHSSWWFLHLNHNPPPCLIHASPRETVFKSGFLTPLSITELESQSVSWVDAKVERNEDQEKRGTPFNCSRNKPESRSPGKSSAALIKLRKGRFKCHSTPCPAAQRALLRAARPPPSSDVSPWVILPPAAQSGISGPEGNAPLKKTQHYYY